MIVKMKGGSIAHYEVPGTTKYCRNENLAIAASMFSIKVVFPISVPALALYRLAPGMTHLSGI